MQVRGPLMVEHRLIERMIALIKAEIGRIQTARELDPVFLETALDFIRVYADRTHHGKEEEILFRALATKDMAPDHDSMMRNLVKEHQYARELTAKIAKAKDAYVYGEKDALERVVSMLSALADFYPGHIAREDNEFFPAVIDYLDEHEQEIMLDNFFAFDRSMVHWKYKSVIDTLEKSRT